MPTRQPLICGEVLFDEFPDGKRVLGGAPFNVAWNLQGLGLAPVFVSAVGRDQAGDQVRVSMQSWGMATAGLQVSQESPTGRVQVTLDAGEPTFTILDRQAYDDIRFPSLPTSDDFWLSYVGSLAFRREPSRSTIRRLIQESGLPRFVDINLRPPWFERETVDELLAGAEWIKLNADELSWIAEADCLTGDDIGRATEKLRRRYGGRQYFITCGSAGAYAIDDAGTRLFVEAPAPAPMVDAVGAGDAFAAATIFGIDRDLAMDELLQVAVGFASRACTIQGATSQNHNHYSIQTGAG